jgi:thiol-disulfide isomerase/thioredoxin
MAEEPMDETAEETMMDLPAWQTLSLTNARTGETFTLADFAGKTVFVEPMATWCSNCRQQLQTVQSLQGQVGDDVVFVALSVETTISAAELATYAQNQGFDFHFAVMTPEILQALAAEFGQSIANPPATPHFVINPDGSFTSLSTGIETADELLAKIQG